MKNHLDSFYKNKRILITGNSGFKCSWLTIILNDFGANVIKAIEGKHANGEWHYHKLKNETFYLESGKLKIYYGTHKDIKKAKILIMNPHIKQKYYDKLQGVHPNHGK